MKRALDMSSKHVELPKDQWEDPWREFDMMEKLLQESQAEDDERRAVSGQWWMPNQFNRENYYSYNTGDKWWFSERAKAPQLK
jgi:hypothetical protein